eukprot:PhF_6_TR20693/c0_g1_i2/m.29767
MSEGDTANPTDEVPLIHVLEDYFSDGSVTTQIANFLFSDDLKDIIVDFPDGQDHPPQNYEAYMKYSDLIEGLLVAFTQENDVEGEYLVGACYEASEKYNGVYTCVDYILAATDYVCFLALVSDYRGMK